MSESLCQSPSVSGLPDSVLANKTLSLVTSPSPSVRVHFPLARVWFCKEENGFLYTERLRTCLSVVWVLELGNQTTVASDTNPASSLSDGSVLGSLWGFWHWGEVQSLIRFVVWRRIEIALSD